MSSSSSSSVCSKASSAAGNVTRLPSVAACGALSSDSAACSKHYSCDCPGCRCDTPGDVEKLDCTDLIPLTVHVPDKALLWRLPGVVVAAGAGSSTGMSGKKHKHPKEHSVAYGTIGAKVPGISRHMSGLQTITVQATLQAPDALSTSATVPTYLGQYFTLAQVPNSSAYTAVFDEYKIDHVEVWVNPNPVTSLPAATIRGLWSSAVDYDDANTPGSVSTVSDKQNSLTTTGDDAHYHKWCPKFAIGTYSGTFVSFASSTGWVDCASPNVQHYGLKLAFSPTGAGIQGVALTTRYTISFRGPGIS